MVTERSYARIELPDLLKPDSPDYVEVRGIARASRQSPLADSMKCAYMGVLQSPHDPTFFAYLTGFTRDEQALTKVLSMLNASSETGLSVIVRGSRLPEDVGAGVHHIAEIELGNLKYVCDPSLINAIHF